MKKKKKEKSSNYEFQPSLDNTTTIMQNKQKFIKPIQKFCNTITGQVSHKELEYMSAACKTYVGRKFFDRWLVDAHELSYC